MFVRDALVGQGLVPEAVFEDNRAAIDRVLQVVVDRLIAAWAGPGATTN